MGSPAGVAAPASADPWLSPEVSGCLRGQPVVSVGAQSALRLLQQILFMGGAGNSFFVAQWKANHSLPSEFHLLTNKIFV